MSKLPPQTAQTFTISHAWCLHHATTVLYAAGRPIAFLLGSSIKASTGSRPRGPCPHYDPFLAGMNSVESWAETEYRGQGVIFYE